ncbi:MAG: hypothetical protein OEQ39_13205 [Gammaproteobacteria bacterium]|nr:hypothetical protein [Gammaproteobacteria bacterium]MDH3466375.1 hypothetical protein [Gammaproteobacteria bacterium]
MQALVVVVPHVVPAERDGWKDSYGKVCWIGMPTTGWMQEVRVHGRTRQNEAGARVESNAGSSYREQLPGDGCSTRGIDGTTIGRLDDVTGISNVAGAGCAGAATYRIAVGPREGGKVFTLQTIASAVG